jgi:hypothetical protein
VWQGDERPCFICQQPVTVNLTYTHGAWEDITEVTNEKTKKGLIAHCNAEHPGQFFHFLVPRKDQSPQAFYDVKHMTQKML